MREKKDYGKKPVRRSKSVENEPARVYRPRTIKLTSWEPRERNDEKSFEGDPQMERRPARSSKREDTKETFRKPKYQEDTGYSRSRSKRTSKDNDKGDAKKAKRRILKKDDADYNKSRSRGYEHDRSKRTFGEKEKEERFSDRKTKFRSGDDRYKKKHDNRDKPYEKDSKRSEGKYTRERRFDKREKFSNEFSNADYAKVKDTKLAGKKLSRKPPQIDSDIKTDKDGNIRLNKFIANSGLCSRREADEYIAKGYITVNGITVNELGIKVKITDEIRFKGKELDPERKVYILLNKPKDYITTVDDPNAKRTVMELIEGACDQRVYPVGRLDRNSTGLLLLTNDGELTKRLTHPSFMKKKVYEVGLDKPVRIEDIEAIANGVEIDDETVKADAVEYIDPKDKSLIGIEIHSGQNRIVRRIFEMLGYRVQKLDRVYFAGLTKKNLPRGKWRFLNQKEVDMLKMNRF